MSEAQHLADSLTSYFNSDKLIAFAPFSVATNDLTAAQAAHVPAERFNSVWAIVNHVWFWNEVPLRMLRGEAVEPKDLGAEDWSGWPSIGDPADDAAWQTARQRCLEANAAFAAFVAEMDEAALEREVAPGWGPAHGIIQGMIAHNSYHTNEVISVRHMQGLWLERT
ncbi:DinB family protein [Chloroflexales bacterium ZM16-3]|nr:DinB family protein [Chloroflexales bacterium ZM16-3]